MHGQQSVTAEAGPAAGSTTREPPGTGFNIELKTIPLDGRIVLLPPDDSSGASDDDSRASNGSRDDHTRTASGNGQRRSR